MADLIEIKVPDIGDYSGVEVIEVAVAAGDSVEIDDTLITLETDKASMDIPATHAGTIKDLKISVGDKVSQGDLILTLESSASAQNTAVAQENNLKQDNLSNPEESSSIESKPEQKSEKPPAASSTQPQKVENLEKVETPNLTQNNQAHAGPATRRFARQLGVDLTKVAGTGRNGRILSKDVQLFVKQAMQNPAAISGQTGLVIDAPKSVDFSKFGDIETKKLSRIKQLTAKAMTQNWLTIPHVTQFDEADITDLEKFRKDNKQAALANNIKLTPLAFIIKACLSALKAFPQVNASLDPNGKDLILKKYYHIGVAVNTDNGLVVPVIRDVDRKGVFEIAREIGELSEKARKGELKGDDMQGSSFTISSLGNGGGTQFTPIINAPDVAILGVSKLQIKPMFNEASTNSHDLWIAKKMLPLALSYDHRVIDGVEGANFMAHIVQQLQDIRKLLL